MGGGAVSNCQVCLREMGGEGSREESKQKQNGGKAKRFSGTGEGRAFELVQAELDALA